jgi:hypothetical protein
VAVAVEPGGRERLRRRCLRLANALARAESIIRAGAIIRPGAIAARVSIALNLTIFRGSVVVRHSVIFRQWASRGLCHLASSRASSSVTTDGSSLVNSGAGTPSGVPGLIGIDSQRAAVR